MTLAVVTGASAGMGAEFARQLAQRGHDVLLVARRADRLEAVAAELKAKHGRTGHVLALDLAGAGAAEEVLARAEALGGADVLVNNAGFGSYGAFVDSEPAKDLGQIRLNCEALAALMHAFLPGMLERKRGAILNVASLAGFQPVPWMSTYAATKAFVLSLTEAVSEEVRGSGVTLCALCPGPVSTEFFEVAFPGRASEMRRPPGEKSPPEIVRSALAALDSGAVVRIPTALWWLTAFSQRFAPRALVRRISGNTVKPSVTPR